jgi:hypothetical protein
MKYIIFIVVVMLTIATVASANPFLVSDPCEGAEYFVIRILNETPETDDDQEITVPAKEDLTLEADLVNFPTGTNNIMVRSGNTWEESTEVPFEFVKEIPGVSSNIAIVNINGVVYLICDPQQAITQYRIIVDGVDYVVNADENGGLMYQIDWVEQGAHSIQVHAINMWGEGNPCPFDFTRNRPNVPENILLIP